MLISRPLEEGPFDYPFNDTNQSVALSHFDDIPGVSSSFNE